MTLCSLNYANPNYTVSVEHMPDSSSPPLFSWTRRCSHFQNMILGNCCLSKIFPTVHKACLCRCKAFLRGVHVMWRELLWQLRESPADMSAVPRGFLFMPAFPSDWQKIWVAPFHTSGVEKADNYLSVYAIRSDDPPPPEEWHFTRRWPRGYVIQRLLQAKRFVYKNMYRQLDVRPLHNRAW